jgi:hypothetical protein
MQWLRSFDQRVRESIDYAICLNSVGSWSNDLWMHVSKPPENPYIKQIFEVCWSFQACQSTTSIISKNSHIDICEFICFQSFSDVSKEMGVSVGIKHKKINVSNSRVCTLTLFWLLSGTNKKKAMCIRWQHCFIITKAITFAFVCI